MTAKRRRSKVRRTGLDDQRWCHLFLSDYRPENDDLYPPGVDFIESLRWSCGILDDSDLLREAWQFWQARIMAWYVEHRPGTPPLSWWQFETPLEFKDSPEDNAAEFAYLQSHGLLTEREQHDGPVVARDDSDQVGTPGGRGSAIATAKHSRDS